MPLVGMGLTALLLVMLSLVFKLEWWKKYHLLKSFIFHLDKLITSLKCLTLFQDYLTENADEFVEN